MLGKSGDGPKAPNDFRLKVELALIFRLVFHGWIFDAVAKLIRPCRKCKTKFATELNKLKRVIEDGQRNLNASVMNLQSVAEKAIADRNAEICSLRERLGIKERIDKTRADEHARVERAKAARTAREQEVSDSVHQVEYVVKGWVSGIRLSVTPSIDNKQSLEIKANGEWSHTFEAHAGDVLSMIGTMPSVTSDTDFVIKVDGAEVAKTTLRLSHERGGLSVVLNADGSVTQQAIDSPTRVTRNNSRNGASPENASEPSMQTTRDDSNVGIGSGRGKLVSETHTEGWTATRD